MTLISGGDPAQRSASIVPSGSFRWLLLITVMFMNFGEAINTSSLSIFTVNLKSRYDVDNTALGTLFAIRKFISVFSPLISGAFIRRFGFAPVLLLSVSMLCCGSLLLLVSVRMRLGFSTLSLGFMIASTFFSTAQVAAFTGYSKVFRGGELALAFALDYASFQFGAGLCGFIAPSLVNIVTNDFSPAFALSSIAIFISFLICIFVLFRAPLYLDRDGGIGHWDKIAEGFKHMLKLSRVAYCAIVFSIFWLCSLDNIKYFSSDYMQSQMNVELGTASRLYSISGLAAAISGPLLGIVYDKFGLLPLFLLISSVVLIPTSVLYLFFVQLGLTKPSTNMGVLVSSIVLMAVSEASQATIKQVILVRTLPTSHYSILQGLTLSMVNAFAGISLYIVGLISKTDPSYTSASIMTQCFVVMLLVLSVMIYIFDAQSGGSLSVPSSMEVIDDADAAPKDPIIADEDDESEVSRLVHQAVPQRSDSRVVSVHYDDARTAASSRTNSRTLTK